MKTFERSILINCSCEELFAFHLDTDNILKITPKNIKVEVLNKKIIPVEGSILNIKSTKNFIPLKWTVQIQEIKEPHLLVDVALKSPFKHWEHQHRFINHGKLTELIDIVRYRLPFGFIGNIFNPFIYNDLEKMFEYRQEQTKKILEEKVVS